MTSAAEPRRAPRPPRPPRTLVQKLAPIVLGFESIVVILAGLTIFGLKALPAGIEPWWAIVGSVVVALACLATAGMAHPGDHRGVRHLRSRHRFRRADFRRHVGVCDDHGGPIGRTTSHRALDRDSDRE